MRILRSATLTALLLVTGTACAASSWSFENGTVFVKSSKGNDATEKLSPKGPLSSALTLDAKDSMRITLTTTEDGKATRAHQAIVMIREEETGLEAPFALDVKSNGKGSVDIPHKELPVQLLLTEKPLHASIVIGSFGSSEAMAAPLFDIEVRLDPNMPPPAYEKPLRYGKQPEIHHVFNPGPKSPPMAISIVFAAAVLVTIPALFGVWIALGANVSHLSKAMGAAPVSHSIFFGSIIAIEGVFLMYHIGYNLFQILPAICVLGLVSFLSGSKALGEVQSRRLAGER